MRRPRRLSSALFVLSVLVVSLGATSCGGGAGGNPDLVLVGFNVPNIAGVPLNQPLIFTFSNDIDPDSITPDTLRVVGALGPNFETTIVDGNLIALLPRSPNFESYSDSGLLPGVEYTVSLAKFPAPDTIRTPDGKPLIDALTYQFTTTPGPTFIEPRRPINHGLPPTAGGTSDDEGCLDNPDNSLPASKQFGSDIGARLLCLKNEGAPQIILDQCTPTHNDQGVGVPSAVTAGFVNLPALRVRFNEPLDPITVVPYVPTDKFGLNVQLWLVGDTDRVPLPPRQIRTNKPLIVQSLSQTEIILVAANEDQNGDPVGGVPQGTYLINVTSAVTDLPGLSLNTADRPSPAIGGFEDVEDNVNASGDVPPGYRIYIVSLVVPGTPTSIIEGFSTNNAEHGDALSGSDEPGIFWESDLQDPLNPNDDVLSVPMPGSLTPAAATPALTLISFRDDCGQSTSANWHGGFRFLGLPSLTVNTDVDDGAGVLKAVFKPYLGDGSDGVFTSANNGTLYGYNTDTGSTDGDGIYEYESFELMPNDTMNVTGSRPLLILCRGDFTLNGTVIGLAGLDGGPGLDTDGNVRYEHPASIPAAGLGSPGAPGGGDGGMGADPLLSGGDGTGEDGLAYETLFGTGTTSGGIEGYANPTGGGGGGMANGGDDGTDSTGAGVGNGGPVAQHPELRRNLALFEPDRTYSPNTNASGGTGGGGGGLDDTDTSGTATNNDAGGGGGGGGGGGLYVIAGDEVVIGGWVYAHGGDGGDTYAVADQEVNLGDDGVAGGTDADADFVVGINSGAVPSGAGGPGGGGAGGTLFFVGVNGVTINNTAIVTAKGGMGGQSGPTSAGTGNELIGGDGDEGVLVCGTMNGAPITIAYGLADVDPVASEIDYEPTIDNASVGQSEWIDLFTPTSVFKKFSWMANFTTLAAAGLDQGVHYDAWLEVQGAELILPTPPGVPTTAVGLTEWTVINANNAVQNNRQFDGAPASPIDLKRYIRWRWRFRLDETYPYKTEALPSVDSLTTEFER